VISASVARACLAARQLQPPPGQEPGHTGADKRGEAEEGIAGLAGIGGRRCRDASRVGCRRRRLRGESSEAARDQRKGHYDYEGDCPEDEDRARAMHRPRNARRRIATPASHLSRRFADERQRASVGARLE